MGSDESHSDVSVGSDGQSNKTVSTNHNLSEEEGEPNQGHSTYQPNTLPLGQTSSLLCDVPELWPFHSLCRSVFKKMSSALRWWLGSETCWLSSCRESSPELWPFNSLCQNVFKKTCSAVWWWLGRTAWWLSFCRESSPDFPQGMCGVHFRGQSHHALWCCELTVGLWL